MFYAAYGSNLNVQQMGIRCPSAKIVGSAELPDYRLMFKGSKTGSYLTVEKAKGFTVPIGIWQVSEDDVRALDRYEGFPHFYYKRNIILDMGGKWHRCLIYIMHEDALLGIPSLQYMDICMEGYADFGFDAKKLKDAFCYSKKRRGYVA